MKSKVIKLRDPEGKVAGGDEKIWEEVNASLQSMCKGGDSITPTLRRWEEVVATDNNETVQQDVSWLLKDIDSYKVHGYDEVSLHMQSRRVQKYVTSNVPKNLWKKDWWQKVDREKCIEERRSLYYGLVSDECGL